MWQFLQSYGIWILFGLFIVLMMRGHAHGGGGCGMGMGHEQHDGQAQGQPPTLQENSYPEGQREVPVNSQEFDPYRPESRIPERENAPVK